MKGDELTLRTPTSKLRYYSIDVGAWENDSKLKRLRIKYGHDGMTVMRDIWEFVYAEGYYMKATINEVSEMIVDYERLPYSKVSRFREVICYLADNGLINKNLLDKGVITSVGIQKRYLETMKVTKRKYEIEKNWLITDVLNAPINTETKPFTSEEIAITSETKPFTSEVNRQSKVNESKVNEIKEKEEEKNEISNQVTKNSLPLIDDDDPNRRKANLAHNLFFSEFKTDSLPELNAYEDLIHKEIPDMGDTQIKAIYKTCSLIADHEKRLRKEN